jgi:hypothetical protein
MSLITRQSMELVMAAVIALFAGVIIAGSLQLDTGWVPETGPQAGYLPLRLGIGLAVISVLIFLQMLRNPEGGGFVTGGQLKSTLAIFLPTVVCYMIKAHGGTGIGKSVLVSSLIIIAFYLVFDLWFQVDLAKGPVESFLGL